MNQLRRQLLLKALKLSDLLIMVTAFVFATTATHFRENNILFEDFLSMRIKVQNLLLFLGLMSGWYLIFHLFNLYTSKRLAGRLSEMADIIKATLTGTLFIVVMSFIFEIEMVTPPFLVYFISSVTLFTIVIRLTLRLVLAQIRVRGRNQRNMLIAGTNQRAVNFARKIEADPELGYQIIGFVDDDWPGLPEFNKSGYPRVSDLKNLSPYIREHVVDEVAINLPMRSYYEHAAAIVTLCEEQGILVRQFSDIFKLKNGHTHLEQLEEDPLITITTGAMRGWQLLAKRMIDFIVSVVLLIVSAPVFLITAIVIELTSVGPVFFIQERVGLNKRIFRMYKFRTMTADAEQRQKELEHLNEASGPVFKIKNDPRITGIGKFLRKTSIDELPQLINIVRGEMSLVGPRPLPLRDYKGFTEDWHRRRVSVKPGVTCLWQVNGRSDTSFEKWMELDMQYIDNWSLLSDLKILIKTIPVVIWGYGAS
jgi:exopolysaccharide biosynthesis polyprenyl glycosylphosphotransferase